MNEKSFFVGERIVGRQKRGYKGLMRKIFFTLALAGIVFGVTACSSPPHVHKPGQFNRGSANFGRPVSDISSVTICYSSYSATPEQVNKLAAGECAAFNKISHFENQQYNTCPLTTPVAAIYTCRDSEGGIGGGYSQADPGGTLINYDGILFRY